LPQQSTNNAPSVPRRYPPKHRVSASSTVYSWSVSSFGSSIVFSLRVRFFPDDRCIHVRSTLVTVDLPLPDFVTAQPLTTVFAVYFFLAAPVPFYAVLTDYRRTRVLTSIQAVGVLGKDSFCALGIPSSCHRYSQSPDFSTRTSKWGLLSLGIPVTLSSRYARSIARDFSAVVTVAV